jgi:hypothetical protein
MGREPESAEGSVELNIARFAPARSNQIAAKLAHNLGEGQSQEITCFRNIGNPLRPKP